MNSALIWLLCWLALRGPVAVKAAACATGFLGSICQYNCADYCDKGLCLVDACDTLTCDCNDHGVRLGGLCKCDIGYGGFTCNSTVTQSCSQSQNKGGTPDVPRAGDCDGVVLVCPYGTYGPSNLPVSDVQRRTNCAPATIGPVRLLTFGNPDLGLMRTHYTSTFTMGLQAFELFHYFFEIHEAVSGSSPIYTIHSAYNNTRTLEVSQTQSTTKKSVTLSTHQILAPSQWRMVFPGGSPALVVDRRGAAVKFESIQYPGTYLTLDTSSPFELVINTVGTSFVLAFAYDIDANSVVRYDTSFSGLPTEIAIPFHTRSMAHCQAHCQQHERDCTGVVWGSVLQDCHLYGSFQLDPTSSPGFLAWSRIDVDEMYLYTGRYRIADRDFTIPGFSGNVIATFAFIDAGLCILQCVATPGCVAVAYTAPETCKLLSFVSGTGFASVGVVSWIQPTEIGRVQRLKHHQGTGAIGSSALKGTMFECQRTCQASFGCLYVNYLQDSRMCQMYSGISSSELVDTLYGATWYRGDYDTCGIPLLGPTCTRRRLGPLRISCCGLDRTNVITGDIATGTAVLGSRTANVDGKSWMLEAVDDSYEVYIAQQGNSRYVLSRDPITGVLLGPRRYSRTDSDSWIFFYGFDFPGDISIIHVSSDRTLTIGFEGLLPVVKAADFEAGLNWDDSDVSPPFPGIRWGMIDPSTSGSYLVERVVYRIAPVLSSMGCRSLCVQDANCTGFTLRRGEVQELCLLSGRNSQVVTAMTVNDFGWVKNPPLHLASFFIPSSSCRARTALITSGQRYQFAPFHWTFPYTAYGDCIGSSIGPVFLVNTDSSRLLGKSNSLGVSLTLNDDPTATVTDYFMFFMTEQPNVYTIHSATSWYTCLHVYPGTNKVVLTTELPDSPSRWYVDGLTSLDPTTKLTISLQQRGSGEFLAFSGLDVVLSNDPLRRANIQMYFDITGLPTLWACGTATLHYGVPGAPITSTHIASYPAIENIRECMTFCGRRVGCISITFYQTTKVCDLYGAGAVRGTFSATSDFCSWGPIPVNACRIPYYEATACAPFGLHSGVHGGLLLLADNNQANNTFTIKCQPSVDTPTYPVQTGVYMLQSAYKEYHLFVHDPTYDCSGKMDNDVCTQGNFILSTTDLFYAPGNLELTSVLITPVAGTRYACPEMASQPFAPVVTRGMLFDADSTLPVRLLGGADGLIDTLHPLTYNRTAVSGEYNFRSIASSGEPYTSFKALHLPESPVVGETDVPQTGRSFVVSGSGFTTTPWPALPIVIAPSVASCQTICMQTVTCAGITYDTVSNRCTPLRYFSPVVSSTTLVTWARTRVPFTDLLPPNTGHFTSLNGLRLRSRSGTMTTYPNFRLQANLQQAASNPQSYMQNLHNACVLFAPILTPGGSPGLVRLANGAGDFFSITVAATSGNLQAVVFTYTRMSDYFIFYYQGVIDPSNGLEMTSNNPAARPGMVLAVSVGADESAELEFGLVEPGQTGVFASAGGFGQYYNTFVKFITVDINA